MLANRSELRVSPKLSGSGAMFTNIRLGWEKDQQIETQKNTKNKSFGLCRNLWATEVEPPYHGAILMENSRFAVSPQAPLQKVRQLGVPVWNVVFL